MKLALTLALTASILSTAFAGICTGIAPSSYSTAVQSNSQFQPAIDELKKHPVATWYVDNGGDSIDALLSACPNDTPVIVVYGLPGKDCAAGFSGGGKNQNTNDYKGWVQSLANKVGNRQVIYILEPDAIGLISNNDCASQNNYLSNLKVAKDILASNGNAQIYADVAAWADQGKAVSALKSLGNVAGIAINTSNYKKTSDMVQMCQSYSSATGGLHCIIDTSRNYNGSPQNEWCNAKSAGIGAPPTSNTGNSVVDYYLWLKVPGESDGQCYGQSSDALIGPGAGQFFAQNFQLLWDQGYFVANGAAKIGQSGGGGGASTGSCSTASWNTDYYGNDMARFPVSGDTDSQTSFCCSKCTSTNGCAGYTINGGYCYIKSKLSDPSWSPTAISGRRNSRLLRG